MKKRSRWRRRRREEKDEEDKEEEKRKNAYLQLTSCLFGILVQFIISQRNQVQMKATCKGILRERRYWLHPPCTVISFMKSGF